MVEPPPASREQGLACIERVLQQWVSDGSGWYYKDDTGMTQGGFPTLWMRQWLLQEQLRPDMLVCMSREGPFLPISRLFPDLSQAFAASSGAVDDLRSADDIVAWMAQELQSEHSSSRYPVSQ